ncbi:MAG: nitroreductase family deazaflavin-dependent oxidoreductase [Chloroflexi bacterium]|nr:nitroreductase family deazaflavin-dependent oxidoreductase [Anaerolineae bacterium]MCC6565394.1 nitroreductase family deazaflavin-dependent oxidoreductase [Chloroflexota bacterium]MCO6443559.1 nitroreductase family deazaflavin-dependent oxidoreductase [Anaerolineae bacterium]MEB2364991.1 nitroreductase/quinone reductase family protein [Chloroflexota bacterium]NOG48312.1 nitroreductase family deazaflavin-dependent oxidoreductase [Chloroflexota bacterium]
MSQTESPFIADQELIRARKRFIRRMPVFLYRLGFGPLLGVMPILILSARSRSTGGSHYTPLEFRRQGSRIYVLATSPDAQWLDRVTRDPNVTVRIGTRSFPAQAVRVQDAGEAVRALYLFRMNAPIPLRWIYWSGRNREAVRPNVLKSNARRYTFVRLERIPDERKALEPVAADRAWITILVIAALVLLRLAARSRRG